MRLRALNFKERSRGYCMNGLSNHCNILITSRERWAIKRIQVLLQKPLKSSRMLFALIRKIHNLLCIMSVCFMKSPYLTVSVFRCVCVFVCLGKTKSDIYLQWISSSTWFLFIWPLYWWIEKYYFTTKTIHSLATLLSTPC